MSVCAPATLPSTRVRPKPTNRLTIVRTAMRAAAPANRPRADPDGTAASGRSPEPSAMAGSAPTTGSPESTAPGSAAPPSAAPGPAAPGSAAPGPAAPDSAKESCGRVGRVVDMIGTSTKRIEFPQTRGGLDHRREADLLAGR